LVAITKIKVVGPSYVDIANKYAPNDKISPIYLDKIIKGGSGVWEVYQWVLILHLTKMKLNQWLNTFYQKKLNYYILFSITIYMAIEQTWN
jgi:cytochrome c551/c552